MRILLIPYYGGKALMLKQIKSLIPSDVDIWVDGCCGSATVTLNNRKFKREIVNDLSDNIINLLHIIANKDTQQELIKRLSNLKCTSKEYKEALENESKCEDKMQKAVYTFILLTQSIN